MAKLDDLAALGQSVWYDYIQRDLLQSGQLQTLIDQGVRGVTSNPAIFEKAISGSTAYDDAMALLAKQGLPAAAIYEALALEDIASAADLLRPVYEACGGRDGFVSLEVDPELAHDTERTISEARRLFKTLARPNVMIKVPATAAGIPAVERLIADGVNVNVTLIFGVDNYRDVAAAYLGGLETLARRGAALEGGLPVERVASVASFFVSRVDTAVDRLLDRDGLGELRGKAAIANAKVAYRAYQEIFSGSRWESLQRRGSGVQRVLWASTSTKDPAYKDTLYVDELIGPDTVNTIPPATLKSYLDHGSVRPSLTENFPQARSLLSLLASAGIDLQAVTRELQKQGVAAFVKPFAKLMVSIDDKRRTLVAA
jgi:transaldolase